MIVVWVALGAVVGAPARYLVDRAVQTRHTSAFPYGTLTVNFVASFVLGVIVGASPSADVVAFAGTGICASLSTYSTFSFETMRLAEVAERGSRRSRATAPTYVVVSVVGGCALAALGWWLG